MPLLDREDDLRVICERHYVVNVEIAPPGASSVQEVFLTSLVEAVDLGILAAVENEPWSPWEVLGVLNSDIKIITQVA